MTPNNPPEPFRPIQGLWWKSPPFIMLWVGIPMLILLCVAPKIAVYYQCVIIAVGGALLVRYMQTRSYPFRYNYGLLSDTPEDLEATLALYTAEIKRYPKQVGAYLRRSVVYMKLARYEEALGDINLVIARQPRFANHYNIRGAIQMQMGQTDGALRDFTMTLQLDPLNFEAVQNRSSAYLELNQLDEALAGLNEALLHLPNEGLVWANRAQVRLLLDDVKGAEADVEHALSLLLNHWIAKMVRGEVRLVKGEITRAVEDLVSAQFLAPAAPAVLIRLMVARLRQNQPEVARELYQKLIADHPRYADQEFVWEHIRLHPSLGPVLREFLQAQTPSPSATP